MAESKMPEEYVLFETNNHKQRRPHISSDANLRLVDSGAQNTYLGSSVTNNDWYKSWVLERIKQSPIALYRSLTGNDHITSAEFDARLESVWNEVATCLRQERGQTINSLADHLIDRTLLLIDNKDRTPSYNSLRSLVFAIIGWQTMLYSPDSGSSLPSQLAIADELSGFQSPARLVLKQDQSACKRPLHETLLGFGIMLPPPNFNVHEDPKDQTAFIDITRVDPSTFNAHLLLSIGRVKLRWIDSLACHLELNRPANILYLYAWPSFCVANLANQSDKAVIFPNSIHACAALDGLQGQWATPDEVDQTLREIILSYRLIFGQNKKARKIFRQTHPSRNGSKHVVDPLLEQLCGRKRSPLSEVQFKERHTYDLIHDLPVLRSRLAVLQQHLNDQKPRAWRDLWHDKRDSAQWFTFWAVVIIGGLGIFLAFLQVVLQAVELGLENSS